jgi:hypothetical protein
MTREEASGDLPVNGNEPDRTSGFSEKALVVLLRASGVLLLTAVIPAAMPLAWMQEIHRQLGMGELPDGPIVGYLTRSLSALYAVHGGLVFFVSLDVRRFLPVVKCLAVLSVVFGIGMIALDVAVQMPLFWVVCEGPFIVVLGGVLLWLTSRVDEGPTVVRK